MRFVPVLLLVLFVGCNSPVRADEPAADAAAAELLTRIETAQKDIDTLRAELRYDRIQELLDDRQRRFGSLLYRGRSEDHPPAFRVQLDRIVTGERLDTTDRAYVFDGRWLLVRDAEEHTASRHEVASAEAQGNGGASGGDMDAGPFVLPLKLERERVLQRFHATTPARSDTDPEGTEHLRLEPRPDYPIEQQRIDLWFDVKTLLPRRVESLDDDGNRSVIDLTKIEVNPAVDATAFDTSLPTQGEWETQVFRLRETSDGETPRQDAETTSSEEE